MEVRVSFDVVAEFRGRPRGGLPGNGEEHMSQVGDDAESAMSVSSKTEGQLRDLAVRYAVAADRGDGNRFTEIFFPDATVTIMNGAGLHTICGHEELRTIPERLQRYDRTFHMLGQSRYRVLRGEASGEAYCIANHLKADVNTVMYIRYEDEYRQNSIGQWLIRSRIVVVDWTETHQISDSAVPRRRSRGIY
jgi:hypothetical protein